MGSPLNYNIPEPKYVPTAGAVAAMQQQIVGAVGDVTRAKAEKVEEEKQRLKADIKSTKAWGDGLATNANGDPMNEGILDTTYGGSGKEYAALKRMTEDTPENCGTPDCAEELKQLEILEQAPERSIAMIGNVKTQFSVLDTDNLDESHPLFSKMKGAQAIMDQISGYGSDQGYGVKVNRVKGDNDQHNGDQELVFTAPCTEEDCPFGESGEWRINSTELERITDKDNLSMMPTNPNQKEQYNEISTKSGIFDEDSNGSVLSPNMFTPGVPPLLNGEPNYAKKPVNKIEIDKNGNEIHYQYEVNEVNEDAIRNQASAFASVEVDTMFDKTAGGPDEAISGWNKNGLAESFKGDKLKEFTEKFPGTAGIFNDDGTINWKAMNDDPDKGGIKAGEPGSLYAANGKIRPEILQLYKDTYTEHYVQTNIKSFIEANDSMSNMLPGSYVQTDVISAAKKTAIHKGTENYDAANVVDATDTSGLDDEAIISPALQKENCEGTWNEETQQCIEE